MFTRLKVSAVIHVCLELCSIFINVTGFILEISLVYMRTAVKSNLISGMSNNQQLLSSVGNRTVISQVSKKGWKKVRLPKCAIIFQSLNYSWRETRQISSWSSPSLTRLSGLSWFLQSSSLFTVNLFTDSEVFGRGCQVRHMQNILT